MIFPSSCVNSLTFFYIPHFRLGLLSAVSLSLVSSSILIFFFPFLCRLFILSLFAFAWLYYSSVSQYVTFPSTGRLSPFPFYLSLYFPFSFPFFHLPLSTHWSFPFSLPSLPSLLPAHSGPAIPLYSHWNGRRYGGTRYVRSLHSESDRSIRTRTVNPDQLSVPLLPLALGLALPQLSVCLLWGTERGGGRRELDEWSSNTNTPLLAST